MNTKKFFPGKFIIGALLLIAGFFLGWLFFHNTKSDSEKLSQQILTEKTIWTCSMHPQIRKDHPGQCPICGMDLILLQNADAEVDDKAVVMSESAMKLAEVQTSIVGMGSAVKEVRLYGKIQPDERLLQSQTAHVPGRIEDLLVNATGESVTKGQLIARIYSPELATAQKELLEAVKISDKYPALQEAAREKLRLLKLTEKQIKTIETSGNIMTTFDIYATTSGVVINRKVSEGDYVNKGDVLFEVADLSRVWGVFDAYESDLAWISTGQEVAYTSQAMPGKVFKGRISFIDPVIDPVTHSTRVRVEIANNNRQFKPEMFLNGIIQSRPVGGGKHLIIPQSAVLWTGTRSIVYVKLPGTQPPSFKMREITLGAALKDFYEVTEGLTEGEEIVTNGTFSVDAAAQLAGKPSMMNPEVQNADEKSPDVMGGHKH